MLADLLPLIALSATVLHGVVMVALASYGLHSLWLLGRFLRHRQRQVIPGPIQRDEPVVLVQVPVFNEAAVVARVVAAVGRLDWPRERLRIQLLDDSTDESIALGALAVANLVAQGLSAVHVRRGDRVGFKAGALALGMELDRQHSDGAAPFIAIFDADFVPPADFLRRALPTMLADDGLAFVQGRWEHLNPEHAMLTRAQAIGIDGHFAVEQGARAWSGLVLNFNGTCGVWRRAAIVMSGGWQHDTLTEDLDLSYRAHLAGWRGAYRFDLAVPGELPQTIESWRSQQFRWAKGSFQTACKLLPTIWRSPWSLQRKLGASLHLTHYAVHPLILLGLLLAPFTTVVVRQAPVAVLIVGAVLLLASMLPPLVLYVIGSRVLRRPWRWLATIPAMTALGTGLAISNTRAAIEAVRGISSAFVRTPKDGVGTGRYRGQPSFGLLEGAAAGWGLIGLVIGWQGGSPWLAPILLLCVVGFLHHGVRLFISRASEAVGDAGSTTRWWPLVPLGLIGTLTVSGMAAQPGSWRDDPWWFATLALLLGASYLLALRVVRARPQPRAALGWILVVGVVMQVIGTGLWHSDDVNRYLVEGRQLLVGQNPYAIAPADPAARALVSPAIAAGVNHPTMTAIYPPLALWTHAAIAGIAPTPAAITVAACTTTIVVLLLVLALLVRHGLPPALILATAWNPVLPLFASGEAHHDIVMAMLVLVALLLAAHGRATAAIIAGTAAVLIKPFALPLLPLLLTGRWRWWWLIPVIVVLAYLPFLDAGRGVVTSLFAFGGSMQFHGALEPLVRVVVASAVPPTLVSAVVRVVLGLLLILGWWWLWRRRAGAPLPTLAVRAFGVLLLCLPTLHPWYFIVVVALLPFARTWALPVWTALAGVYWLHGVGMLPTGTWSETPLVTALAHLPAVGLMAWEAFGPRREPAEPRLRHANSAMQVVHA